MEENSKSKTSLCRKTEESGAELHQMPRAASPDRSCVSVKSENSLIINIPTFTDEEMTSEVR